MQPMIRERCIIEPRFLRSKGRQAVLDRIAATKDRVQALARSHGFVNPEFGDAYYHWFHNRVVTPTDPTELALTWEQMLERGWDCAYVAVVVEGPAVSTLPSQPTDSQPSTQPATS